MKNIKKQLMFQVLREVNDLLLKKPESKKEDEELTAKLQSYTKEHQQLIPQFYSLCKKHSCVRRIMETIKSKDSPPVLAPLLLRDLSGKEVVEILICCPHFLDAFFVEMIQSEREHVDLWEFIMDPETDDILQQSLRLRRLQLLEYVGDLQKKSLLKNFFNKVISNYIQKGTCYGLEAFEINRYYELCKEDESLKSMLREICIIWSQKNGALICPNYDSETLYLALLDRTVAAYELLPFMKKGNVLSFVAAVNYFVHCVDNEEVLLLAEEMIISPDVNLQWNISYSFTSTELALASFILSEECSFDPLADYPGWSIKYCFLRAQLETLKTKNVVAICRFIRKHPQYFDHGFTFLTLVKALRDMNTFELHALLDLTLDENYYAQEICSYLHRYVHSNVILVASEYSCVPHVLKLVKTHFDLLSLSEQRAQALENLVKEEKASQNTLESCLWCILNDIKASIHESVWSQYLRILRRMVDIRLISPVLIWNEILQSLVAKNNKNHQIDILKSVFFILETIHLIPFVVIDEAEDFDESVKPIVEFIFNIIYSKCELSAFAFKTLCTLPDLMIKKLLPNISEELLAYLLAPEAVESLAKYAFLEIQSMPRTLLLGTSESSGNKRNEHVDMSWFQPKKCSYIWFTEEKKIVQMQPILSIPFTLRQVVICNLISHYSALYSTQNGSKLIVDSNVVLHTCSTVAYVHATGSNGRIYIDVLGKIKALLESSNSSEEDIAACLLCLKCISDDGEVLPESLVSLVENVCARKFLDPTVTKIYQCESISEDQTEFKGYTQFLRGKSCSRNDLIEQLKELMSQPMAVGLVNALALAMGYSSANSLDREHTELILNRIPEIAFKQAKFAIWIDAFYFCVIDSNKAKEARVNVEEPSYMRVGREYLARLLIDRRDSLSIQVLARCQYLPRIDWSCLLRGDEEELIMNHVVSRIVKDNPFISPSLCCFAVQLYEKALLSDYLLKQLGTLIEATNRKQLDMVMANWDFEQLDLSLLIDEFLSYGLDVSAIEKFIIVNKKTDLYGLLHRFENSNEPLSKYACLMNSHWALADFERALISGLDENQLSLYVNSPKVEFVDAVLTCLKVREKSFAVILIRKETPFKGASETLLWKSLLVEASLIKRRRILSYKVLPQFN